MRITYAVGIVAAFLVGTVAVDIATSQSTRCATGHVRGFAVVQGDPRLGGVGAIPSEFSGSALYFDIRYNCTAKGVQVKRVDEGVYDVLFPGNIARVVQVTALGNGASASGYRIEESIFRVVIRGPLVRNEVLAPKESAFQITVV